MRVQREQSSARASPTKRVANLSVLISDDRIFRIDWKKEKRSSNDKVPASVLTRSAAFRTDRAFATALAHVALGLLTLKRKATSTRNNLEQVYSFACVIPSSSLLQSKVVAPR